MKILFIHPNMPAQYKHLAAIAAQNPKNEVVFATHHGKGQIKGVRKVEYKSKRSVNKATHHYLHELDGAISNGQSMWAACEKLKSIGFYPDIICAHSGWGDALYVKDSFPTVPLLSYCEFYYTALSDPNGNFYYNPFTPLGPNNYAFLRIKNSNNLLNLEACDWGITPTFWQLAQHPKEFQPKISVIHDGIDTEFIKPKTMGELTLPGEVKIDARNNEIITYVARTFEPVRGFETFMRALEIINRERPDCHVLIIGEDGISYGDKPKDGDPRTYKERMLSDITLTDPSRVHWLGKLSYQHYLKALYASHAHIYLTVPFVLSWSMLESMAAGCALIGSNTPPVTEVIQDGFNGLLTDFHDHNTLAKRVSDILDHPDKMKQMRQQARKTILDKYSLTHLMPRHFKLLEDVAKGNTPNRYINEIPTDFSRTIYTATQKEVVLEL